MLPTLTRSTEDACWLLDRTICAHSKPNSGESAIIPKPSSRHCLLVYARLTADGRVVSLNAEGERLLGWSETVCVGTFLHDIIGCHVEQGEGDDEVCPIRQVLQSGKPAWAFAECLAAP